MAIDYTASGQSGNLTPIDLSTRNEDIFPHSPDDLNRVNTYEFYERLFFGQHFAAFNIAINDKLYSKEYQRLRYVVANFPGLISKVVSDMLFIEPPKIKVPDGDQAFMDALIRENRLRTQNYESALANSYLGDNLYKLRVGKRSPNDLKPTVIIEEVTPKIYFPKINPYNVKGQPDQQDLAWIVKVDDKSYLRKEIHIPGKIFNKLYLLEGDKIVQEVPLSTLGLTNIPPEEDTKINRSLLIHIPNWRAGNRHFGISDYYDLDTLFYAMNNRLTKIDNVLDTHSDPILSLPDGILDEQGKVKRGKLGLFERPPEATKDNDPAYITWDANLDSAFSEIDKLVEMTFMMSETAPDILGMGQGKSDSGRALKLKILRTIAKAQRKQLYYTEGLTEVLYVAQLLAKEWGLEVDGVTMQGDAVKPDIEWKDGLPADMTELVDIEAKRIDAGITSRLDSIMRVDDVDEATAKKKLDEIQKEDAVMMPMMNTAGNAQQFGNKSDTTQTNPVKPAQTPSTNGVAK